jgi:hypothetical protein
MESGLSVRVIMAPLAVARGRYVKLLNCREALDF